MKIHDDITKTIGHTPLVRLNRIVEGTKGQPGCLNRSASVWLDMEKGED